MKSTCCLAVFYLFYRLFLSRDTFHRFNRMALLSVIAFSVTIPFVRFTTEEPTRVQRAMFDMEQLLQMADAPVGEAEAGDFPLGLMVLFAVYIGGCLFFTGRFLYSVWQIVRLIHAGEVTVLEDGTRLVVTERTNPPFSWMKYVVISRIDMEESGAEILAHERAHIKACHSLDLWLAGCCTVLHWFNPAAWLLKQELQNVHEYEADEQVIAHGVDARHYQLLLIKKAVGSQRFTSMANSFNHSKLKNRITMMLKQKSNPWARLKFLYVLPLAAVTVVAFARPEISRQLEMIADVELPEVFEKSQHGGGGKITEPLRVEQQPVVRQKVIETETTMAKTSVKDTVIGVKKAIRPDIESHKLLYVLNGMEIPDLDLQKLDPVSIGSITVLKGEKAVELYGKKGKHGVLLITTKHSPVLEKRKDEQPHKKENGLFRPLPGADIKLRPAPRIGGLPPVLDPIVIVDGKEMPYSEFKKIDAERIRSMSVLKKELALRKYGEKFRRRSVIEIELKKKDI